MTQPTHADESPDVVPARPRAQIVAVAAILLGSAVGLGFVLAFHVLPYVRRYLAGASRFEIANHMQNVLFALAALMLLGSLIATWHGIRLLRAGRWPLPGAFVMKDTRVRRGDAAKALAVTFILLGATQAGLAVLALVLPKFLYQGVPVF